MTTGKVRTISSTEFQRNIGTVVDEVHAGGTVIVKAHGRDQVAIISVAEYDALCEARRQLTWARLAKMNEEPKKGARSS